MSVKKEVRELYSSRRQVIFMLWTAYGKDLLCSLQEMREVPGLWLSKVLEILSLTTKKWTISPTSCYGRGDWDSKKTDFRTVRPWAEVQWDKNVYCFKPQIYGNLLYINRKLITQSNLFLFCGWDIFFIPIWRY